jgi:hypothetical protein
MTSRTDSRHPIEPSPQQPAALAEALRLAAQGWPVFPCVPGAKRPLTGHGLLDASTDPHRIRAWWRRTPTANLAVPTGTATVDVLDVDVRATGSGFAAFNRLRRAGLLTGSGQVITTPSGGLHLYFTGADQPSSRLPDHYLDLKANGGYVLVPPSVVDGRGYALIRPSAGPTTRLDWDAVRTLLDPRPPSRIPVRGTSREAGDIAALVRWVELLPEGRRNSGTFWAACRAVEQGVPDLAPLVDAAVRAGLPEREAARTVASAVRRLHSTTPAATARRPSLTPGRRGRS